MRGQLAMTGRRLGAGLALCLLTLWAGVAGAAPGGAATEAEIKAAMLFNFTKFMEWSGAKGDAKAPVVIGVAGDEGIYEALEGLVRERTAGRPVTLRRIEQPADGELSHLLYLGKGVKKRWADFLAAPRQGVVAVGDGESFCSTGGTVGFIVSDNRLRFEVNLAAANSAGVTISSRLLRLATEVRQ